MADPKVKSSEELEKDFDELMPHELASYIESCEFYDRSDAFDVLQKAVDEFKNKGGVASSLLDASWRAVVNSVGLVLLRKFNEPLYKKAVKSRTTNFAEYAKKAFEFKLEDYGDEERNLYSVESLQQDLLRRGMVRHPGEPGPNDKYDPLFDVNEYRRQKDFQGNSRASDFVKSRSEDRRTVRTVGGDNVSLSNADGDHVTPLKMVHENSGHFIERYVDLDKKDSSGRTVIQQIVNDDSNFQVLSSGKNRAKGGGMTNLAFIEQCDKMDKAAGLYRKMQNATGAQKRELQAEISALGLSPNKRRAARLMADEENLSPEDKKKIEKYKLTDKERKELKENQKKSEAALRKALLTEGAKTVAYEQIGRIIEIVAGPIGFEIRDSIANGISHGFAGCNSFEAFCKRLWRALKYTIRRLGDLLKDALGDFAKMLATFFMNACSMLKTLFGKFFDLALSGISVLVESVKILMGEGTAAQKGDAILKVVVGFATGILGQAVIDAALESIGLPDPFSDIFAAIFSALLSTAVMALFDRLDLFGLKREMLQARIDEIFDERERRRNESAANFDRIANAAIAINRLRLGNLRRSIDSAILAEEYPDVSRGLSQFAGAYGLQLHSWSKEEMSKMLRQANSRKE